MSFPRAYGPGVKGLKAKVLYLVPLILAIAAGSSRAQSQLDSLISVALRDNPVIEAARYGSLAARDRISSASQLPDPQLKIAAMNVPTSLSLNSDMMTMLPQITIMQMLPWFGKLNAAGDIEKYNYGASNERLSATALEVVTSLKKTYASIYGTEKTITLLEYRKELLRGVVKVAEQLFAVGQVPQQDVFRATAELTMVESDIVSMRGKLADEESKLGAILGMNRACAVAVDTLQLPRLDSLQVLEARLETGNPSLKEMHDAELAAGARKVFAKKDAIPDISVGVSYGYRSALMADGQKASDMVSLEVGVGLPVFFGSKQQKAIDEADFTWRGVRAQYAAAKVDLFGRLRSAYADADAQSKLLSLYSQELIPQYVATYNASLSAYSVGKTTFAMLMDNLTMLVNTRIELAGIQSKYFADLAEIRQLVGEGGIE